MCLERTDYAAVVKEYKLCGTYSRSVQPRNRFCWKTTIAFKKSLKMKTSTVHCSQSLRDWKFRYARCNACSNISEPALELCCLIRDLDAPLILPHLFLARITHDRAVCILALPVLPPSNNPWPIFYGNPGKHPIPSWWYDVKLHGTNYRTTMIWTVGILVWGCWGGVDGSTREKGGLWAPKRMMNITLMNGVNTIFDV